MPRWTERERQALMDDLRDEVELVWMTGELHLEKPTVDREVAWGLHFFDETLFEMLPETLGSLEEALRVPIRARGSRCRPSSSSARGSAATATATPSSPPR